MEDRVLDQQGIVKDRHDVNVDVAERATISGLDFPVLLQSLREQRGLSKADLAKRCGYDPSTITRFEQGSRAPDREAVLLLATTMVLPLVDKDRLLASAGFRSVLWDDPLLIELAQSLVDPSIPEVVRAEMRTVIQMAMAYGQFRRIGY